MAEELKDRYGRLQPPVENLLLVMRLRQLSREKGVESIEQQKGQTIIKFQKEKKFERASVAASKPLPPQSFTACRERRFP